MIRKSFDAVETKVVDAANGLVDVIYSVTGNLDRQNDVIEPGAFGSALASKGSVPVVYGHKWDDINQVLGKTVGMRELLPGNPELPDSLRNQGFGGVKARIQFDQETPAGRVAFTHVKNKNLGEYSFAFDITDDGEKFESDARHIKSIKEIYEVTLALIGANPATTTMAFKAMVEAEAAGQKQYRQGRKTFEVDAQTGELVATHIEAIEINPSIETVEVLKTLVSLLAD